MAQILNDQETKTIVTAAQQGDEQAFSELFRRSVSKQYHYACMILQDSFAAEDVLQEVYIKLYKNIQRIEDPGKFEAYLSRMTFNQCMLYKRKKYHTTESSVEDDQLITFEDETLSRIPEDNALQSEKSKTLAAALRSLSDEECYAFLMHFYEDKSVRWIAESLSLSESTVKRRIGEARKKLAAYLTEREMRGLLLAPMAVLSTDQQSVLLNKILTACKKDNSPRKKDAFFKKAAIALLSFIGALLFFLGPSIASTIKQASVQEPVAEATATPLLVDKDPPIILSSANDNSSLTLVLYDASGIAYSGVYLSLLDGSHLPPESVDASTGTVIFSLPSATATLHVEDTLGNAGSTVIEIEKTEN